MRKQLLLLIGVGILNLALFAGIFALLQNASFYESTLGRISQNYEKTGSWGNHQINKVSKPFVAVTPERLERWDAAIYNCIRLRDYTVEADCYGHVKSAFFPLFPLLWKATGSSALGISIINYLMFVLGLALLVLLLLLDGAVPHKAAVFALLVSLPSTVIFYIPYSEALFMFTFSIAALGIVRGNYRVLFVGCFLLAMVRPATLFVLLAILATEVLVLFVKRDFRAFSKAALLKSAPFVLGYACAIWIQYLSAGSWTAMLEAQQHWAGGLQPFREIVDWSVEGFGLSTFALFFVCLPLLVLGGYALLQGLRGRLAAQVQHMAGSSSSYLATVAGLYMLGILAFTLLTSGGNLHSFFRFTLASPLFYVLVLVLLKHLSRHAPAWPFALFALSTLTLIVFLNTVDYAGSRLGFSFFGLYLYMATGLLLLLPKSMPRPAKLALGALLVLLNTVWNAYLLNAFLSDGWIFT